MKNNTVVETEVPGLLRDLCSGALLNSDIEALHAYKTRKAKIREIEARLNETDERLSRMESSLAQMIELLQSMSKDRK